MDGPKRELVRHDVAAVKKANAERAAVHLWANAPSLPWTHIEGISAKYTLHIEQLSSKVTAHHIKCDIHQRRQHNVSSNGHTP